MDTRPPLGAWRNRTYGIFQTGFTGRFFNMYVTTTYFGYFKRTTLKKLEPAPDIARENFRKYADALRALKDRGRGPGYRQERAQAAKPLGARPVEADQTGALRFGDLDHRASGAVCLAARLGAVASFGLMDAATYGYLVFVPYEDIFKTSSVLAKAGAGEGWSGSPTDTSPLALMWELGVAEVPANRVLAAFKVKVDVADGEKYAPDPNDPDAPMQALLPLFKRGHVVWKIDTATPLQLNPAALTLLSATKTTGKHDNSYDWSQVAADLRALRVDVLAENCRTDYAREWPYLGSRCTSLDLAGSPGNLELNAAGFRRCTPVGSGARVELAKIRYSVGAVPPILHAITDPARCAAPTPPQKSRFKTAVTAGLRWLPTFVVSTRSKMPPGWTPPSGGRASTDGGDVPT